MRTRSFGNSDLKTSVLGYGGWPMGRGQYGDFDDEEAIKAARIAYDLGVNLFDTAAIYGWGYGEKLMSKAIKDFRKDIILVTKGGREWQTGNADRSTATVSTSDPVRLTKSIDESLERLNTDYIDLFLMHYPDKTRDFAIPMEVLEKAKKSGKIRYTGVSNFSPEMMNACRETSPIITNQMGYHIFDRRPEADVFPYLKNTGMGFMSYGSLAHGLLSGTWSDNKDFGDDDWRKNGVNFGLSTWGENNLIKNISVVNKLKSIAEDHGKTIVQLALGWVLSNPNVSVALAGTTKTKNAELIFTEDWVLSDSVKKEIDDLVLAEGSGVGLPGMDIQT